MRYLTLLASPDQDRITEQAWSVVHEVDELAWAGWAPNSAVAVENEPPASWYEAESTQAQASPPLDSFQAEPSPDEAEPPLYTPPQGLDSKVFRELAQRDELHREQSLGRVGWLFLTGTITVAGKTVPCCFPLFERRVKFVRVYEDYLPQWTGGLQRHSLLRRREHELVVDPVDRFLKGDFGSEPVDVARAAGLMLREFGIEVDAITDSTGNPMTYRGADQLILAPGTGFYLAHGSEFTATQSDLHDWSTRHISDTAFAKLYRTDDAALHPHVDDIGPTRSALPLNRRQNEAIDRLDTESVVAVSGPSSSTRRLPMYDSAAKRIAAVSPNCSRAEAPLASPTRSSQRSPRQKRSHGIMAWHSTPTSLRRSNARSVSRSHELTLPCPRRREPLGCSMAPCKTPWCRRRSPRLNKQPAANTTGSPTTCAR